jgi:hypothetical protein
VTGQRRRSPSGRRRWNDARRAGQAALTARPGRNRRLKPGRPPAARGNRREQDIVGDCGPPMVAPARPAHACATQCRCRRASSRWPAADGDPPISEAALSVEHAHEAARDVSQEGRERSATVVAWQVEGRRPAIEHRFTARRAERGPRGNVANGPGPGRRVRLISSRATVNPHSWSTASPRPSLFFKSGPPRDTPEKSCPPGPAVPRGGVAD